MKKGKSQRELLWDLETLNYRKLYTGGEFRVYRASIRLL